MINSLYKVTGHVSPNDEKAFVLIIENDDLKMLKDSFKNHKSIRDNVEFLVSKNFFGRNGNISQ
jgi:hypothetical protein|nr:MAG TPA: hypothetical protein [Caudoviricetes sp.]